MGAAAAGPLVAPRYGSGFIERLRSAFGEKAHCSVALVLILR